MMKASDVVTVDGSVLRRKPVLGDMHWDGKAWQRWSGRRWTKAAYSVHPEFHALMTLVTGGLWGVVWLAVALGRREDRVRFEVDHWGNVWARSVASA